MIVFLQGELRFHRAELSEAFEAVAERMEEPFAAFLRQVEKELEQKETGGFETVWKANSQKLLQKEGFSAEDERLFEMLAKSLGYLDLTMQTESLNLAVLQVEEAVKTAKEQQEMKGKLYKTMGISAGAFLTLLMI